MDNDEAIFISDPENVQQILAGDLINQTQDLLADLISQRKTKGMTQSDVADAIGVTRTAITAFERYDGDPKLSTIVRYAMAVGAKITIDVTDGLQWAKQERVRSAWVGLRMEDEEASGHAAAQDAALLMGFDMVAQK